MSAKPHTIHASIGGVDLELETSPGLFSPRAVDRGTLAFLSRVQFRAGDRVLDLGCGYGVVGILAAKLLDPEQVVLLDADPRAVEVAARNARRNEVGAVQILRSEGFAQLSEAGFSLILCNPPYHADFSVPRHFIEKGFNRLSLGGRFALVTRRETWYRRKLGAIFGGARLERVDGYAVFVSEKRHTRYANARS